MYIVAVWTEGKGWQQPGGNEMKYAIIKEYVRHNYAPEERRNIVKNGMSGGINGLIYYEETTYFYDQYKSQIWDMLTEHAEQTGQTPLEFISHFHGAKDVNDVQTFKNLLCWYAVEETCIAIEAEEEDLRERF